VKKPHKLLSNIIKKFIKDRFFLFFITQHMQGISSNLLQLENLKDKIAFDHPVRFTTLLLIGLTKKRSTMTSLNYSNLFIINPIRDGCRAVPFNRRFIVGFSSPKKL
jgi:hypothetical protein